LFYELRQIRGGSQGGLIFTVIRLSDELHGVLKYEGLKTVANRIGNGHNWRVDIRKRMSRRLVSETCTARLPGGEEEGALIKLSPHKFDLPPAPRGGPGFHNLSESNIRTILEKASIQEYPPQHWLYRQGEPARAFFILKSGLVSLIDLSSAGEETLIGFVLPGEPIGYIPLFLMDEYLLSAQVLQPSVIMGWSRKAALELTQEVPTAAVNLLSNMISDLIRHYHHIRRLKRDPLEKRIEWGLGELARAFGKSLPEGTVIEGVEQRQLAHLAGTTIYGISRELSKLERRGVLRKQRRRIVLIEQKRPS
jgi:CRP-like cAMP-binding protein